MELTIPGRGTLDIATVVLDMNGTIALDGQLLEGVRERLALLAEKVRVIVVTADTFGTAAALEHALGVEVVVISEHEQAREKQKVARRLNADEVAAIGNGANDAAMLRECSLGICVVGGEGAAVEALVAADVVVNNICDALDLLLKPERLKATLRQ